MPGRAHSDKVGNAIIYIVDLVNKKHKKQVHITKLLKLLYIIDELSVIETSAPVTGLEYKVWEMGPVAIDVYYEFAHNKTDMFLLYAESKKREESILIQSVNKFDDSEFSDYEIELMDRVINKYGHLDGPELVELLHEDGGLWKSIVIKNNLLDEFKTKKTTNYTIDLSEKLNDNFMKSLFNNSKLSLSL